MVDASIVGTTPPLVPTPEDEYIKWTLSSSYAVPSVGGADLERACPLDSYKQEELPDRDLGLLDTLPLELLQNILSQVDLRTLVDIRSVNRRALQVIDSIPEYRKIIQHAPDSLRAALCIETASQTTPHDLWETLTTSRCSDCGGVSGLIYLITCQRVCLPCSWDLKRYYPLTVDEAARRYAIPKSVVETLPHMRTLPGHNYGLKLAARGRHTLVDRDAALRAGIALHGSAEATESEVQQRDLKRQYNYFARKARRAADGKCTKVRRPKHIDPLDAKDGRAPKWNIRRFMGVVSVPIIDTTNMNAEYPRHCAPCFLSGAVNQEVVAGTFAKHVEDYGRIEVNGSGNMCHVPPKEG